jgi:hypothetical protein
LGHREREQARFEGGSIIDYSVPPCLRQFEAPCLVLEIPLPLM